VAYLGEGDDERQVARLRILLKEVPDFFDDVRAAAQHETWNMIHAAEVDAVEAGGKSQYVTADGLYLDVRAELM
jgi:hypothetical protein